MMTAMVVVVVDIHFLRPSLSGTWPRVSSTGRKSHFLLPGVELKFFQTPAQAPSHHLVLVVQVAENSKVTEFTFTF